MKAAFIGLTIICGTAVIGMLGLALYYLYVLFNLN